MRHHAYLIAGESEMGIEKAFAFVEKELGMKVKANPDVIVFRYGLLAVEDVRKIISLAGQSAIAGDRKAIVIAASRIYHEAQNALLKLFEEPPSDTTLFLIVPELGQLLPTLRSRVAVLPVSLSTAGRPNIKTSEAAEAFLKMSKERRSAIIKKLANAADEEERQEARDEALALVNGIEAAVYATVKHHVFDKERSELLRDISILRGYLYDRSAPLKMILEHISLVLSKHLV